MFVGKSVLQVPNLWKVKEDTEGDKWVTLLTAQVGIVVVFNSSLQRDQGVAGHNKSKALEMNI